MAERNLMMLVKGSIALFSDEDDLKSQYPEFFDQHGYPKSSMRKYRIYGRIGWEYATLVNAERLHFNCWDMETGRDIQRSPEDFEKGFCQLTPEAQSRVLRNESHVKEVVAEVHSDDLYVLTHGDYSEDEVKEGIKSMAEFYASPEGIRESLERADWWGYAKDGSVTTRY